MVWIIMILNFRVQSFSVKDLGGSGFVHFCPRGDWFNYSVLFYQTNVLIKFSVAMRRTLFSVFFFFCSYSSLSCADSPPFSFYKSFRVAGN